MKIKDFALLLSAVLVVTFSVLFGKNLVRLIISWLIGFSPVAFYYVYSNYRKEKFRGKIEEQLIDSLHRIAANIEIMDFESCIFELADNSELGEKFKVVKNQIKSGMPVNESLENAAHKISNKHFSEAVNILKKFYETGEIDSGILTELAEKLSSERILEKEKNTNVMIQKYTLIASVFIVPLILGSIISLISGLNFGALSEFGMERQEISELPNLIYVLLNSALIAVFLGKLESSKFKMFLYVLIFIPLSVVLFTVSSSGFLLNMA